ncbi:MAG TPA: SigB/SigF/SigG family RNA polymerase sigma factor [Solirubrobacteraceae bacterium]|jgi:RNA polymerase sigma-B factor
MLSTTPVTRTGPGPVMRSRLRDRRADDCAAIVRARAERTPAARSAAVERFMPLARSLARRYQRGEEPLEDLEQVACLGLVKAIDGFDPARGTTFAAFAVPTIVGELRRHFRDKGWAVRVPRDLQELSLKVGKAEEVATRELGRAPTAIELADRLGVGVEQLMEAREARYAMHAESLHRPASAETDGEGDELIDRFGGEDAGYGQAEAALTCESLLSRLPAREQRILRLRYHDELSQSEIAKRIGCSQVHISNLIRRSLEALHGMTRGEAVSL